MFLSCVSDLRCEVGRISLPPGEKPLSIPPLEEFTCDCALLCHLPPTVRAHRVHCCWPCSRPLLTVGMLAVGPGVSKALFSPGHQCRSTEVRCQDCNSHAHGVAVGPMEAAQTLAWFNPHKAHSCQSQTCLSCRSTRCLFGYSAGSKFTKPAAEV